MDDDYGDSCGYGDLDPDGDLSDLEQEELEVRLYSQIHHHTDETQEHLSLTHTDNVQTISVDEDSANDDVIADNAQSILTRHFDLTNSLSSTAENNFRNKSNVNSTIGVVNLVDDNAVNPVITDVNPDDNISIQSNRKTMPAVSRVTSDVNTNIPGSILKDTLKSTGTNLECDFIEIGSDSNSSVPQKSIQSNLTDDKDLKRKEKVVVELNSDNDQSVKSYISFGTQSECGTVTISDAGSVLDSLSSDSRDSLMVVSDNEGFVDDIRLNIDQSTGARKHQPKDCTIMTVGQEVEIEDPRAGNNSVTVGQKVNIEDPGTTLEDVLNSLPDTGWSIIPEDIPTRGRVSRYYKPLTVKCHNCNERGHLSKVCPKPKKVNPCMLCGEQGHIKQRCPNSHCYNCHLPGHSSRECEQPRRRLWEQCYKCEMQGHKGTNCPNRWRQFHVTTDLNNLRRGTNEENSRVYCCNCGKEGHFHHDCIKEMMDKLNRPTWPFITKYELRTEVHLLDREVKRAEMRQQQGVDDVEPQKKKRKKWTNDDNTDYTESNSTNKNYPRNRYKKISDKRTDNRNATNLNKHTTFYESDGHKEFDRTKRKRNSDQHLDIRANKKVRYEGETLEITVNRNHSFVQSAIEAGDEKKKKKKPKKKNKKNNTNSDLVDQPQTSKNWHKNERNLNKNWHKIEDFPRNYSEKGVNNRTFQTSHHSNRKSGQGSKAFDSRPGQSSDSLNRPGQSNDLVNNTPSGKKGRKQRWRQNKSRKMNARTCENNDSVGGKRTDNYVAVRVSDQQGGDNKKKNKRSFRAGQSRPRSYNKETFSSHRGFQSTYRNQN